MTTIASLGKMFEWYFRKQTEQLENVFVLRLYDQMNFKKGSTNPCDFVTYKYPNIYLVELKTCKGCSLPAKNISDHQLSDMTNAIVNKGVKAYVICWFYEKDTCRAFPIDYVWKQFNVHGKKSLRYDDKHGILITGTKKKKFFEWNWEDLFIRRTK